MRNLSLLLAAFPLVVVFSACTGGKDTGDTSPSDTDTDTDADTDTDTDVDFAMIDFSGNCPDSTACDYTITTTTESSLVFLDMTETNDSYLYHEYHDEFTLQSVNADNSETYVLHLATVTDIGDVGNGTTLTNAATVQDGLTWWFGAQNTAGDYDCIVTGDNVAYYSADCTNVR